MLRGWKVLLPRARPLTPHYVWWENVFDEGQLDWLQGLAKKAEKPAVVGRGEGEIEDEIRRTKIRWLHLDPETQFVFTSVGLSAQEANTINWNFDLTHTTDYIQLANYTSEGEGHYGWHQDFGADTIRKLSYVLQLSRPDEYEGGELQLQCGSTIETIPKERGRITMFPSWVFHRVTPVTKGARQTLTTWLLGPELR